MKILVDELPKDKRNCPFYRQDIDGYGGLCTLSGDQKLHCWKDSDDECEMCITYDKFILEKFEKCRNATCINIRSVD